MRTRLFGFLAASLLATAANATSIVTFDGGTSTIALTPGTSKTITIGITPDADLVSGALLIFDVSDTSAISLASCSSSFASSCPVGGSQFSFSVVLTVDASQPFVVGSFTVNVAAGAAAGTTVTLSGTSTITDSFFSDNFVGPATVAQVVSVPEPATAALLALGLGGLFAIGRKRIA